MSHERVPISTELETGGDGTRISNPTGKDFVTSGLPEAKETIY